MSSRWVVIIPKPPQTASHETGPQGVLHNRMSANNMPSGPSDYLAAERTFLAWIRTGLALMGFGFVVARFGLFLRALQAGQSNLPAESYGFSFWVGTALIMLGVVVNIMSARHHARLIRELNAGGSDFSRPSSLGIVVAVILAVLGLVMAVYLISVRDPKQTSLGGDQRGSSGIQSGGVSRRVGQTPRASSTPAGAPSPDPRGWPGGPAQNSRTGQRLPAPDS